MTGSWWWDSLPWNPSFQGSTPLNFVSTWHLLLKCQRNTHQSNSCWDHSVQLLVQPSSEQASHWLTQSSCCLETTSFFQGTYGEGPSGVLVHVSALFMCRKHRQRVQRGFRSLDESALVSSGWETQYLHEVASRSPFCGEITNENNHGGSKDQASSQASSFWKSVIQSLWKNFLHKSWIQSHPDEKNAVKYSMAHVWKCILA